MTIITRSNDSESYHEDPKVVQLHRSIGGYITTFSELISSMRRYVGWFLYPADDARPGPLLHVLFATMTAKPIADSFFGMASQVGDLSEDDFQIRNAIRRAVQHHISFRNDIAHADWTIGWVEAVTNEPVLPSAYKIKSEGGIPRMQNLQLETSDVVRSINGLQILNATVDRLGRTCLARQRGGTVRVSDVLELHRDDPGEPLQVRLRKD